ncbi:MAG: DUF523 domain-containing protein, partial [Lentisphaeria bacterium]|nr:DUF523 domain-containing protein [Lentisphaeria bacterium]
MKKKLKIGISACLLGLNYRYNGEPKGVPMIYELLKDKVELIPICPEYGCGLGVPRPPMRLEASARGTRIKVIESGEDKTEELLDWIDVELHLLERIDIAAFIFKARSPSCGLRNVDLFSPSGRCLGKCGQGLFAAALTKKFPWMTVCEESDFPEIAEKLVIEPCKGKSPEEKSSPPGGKT